MKPAHLWPLAIVAALVTTVGVNLWVMRIASDDPSFAIEPDYYAQAVLWDSTLAQQARNRSLGWSIRPAFVRDSAGVELRAILLDATGREIRDADVTVTAFAVARSARRLEIPLRRASRGYAGAMAAHAMPGRWELRFDVRRRGERMTATQRLDLDGP